MEEYVTSPKLDAHEGIVTSAKEFSDALTLDLNDEEIARAFQIIARVRTKYKHRSFDNIEKGMMIVEEMEKEVQTELAEKLNILARIDVTPMLMGNPPILEVLGKLPGDPVEKYGFDHEKKEWEVKRSTSRNEDFLGQKENANVTPIKRRSTSG
jgi:hypothetical protein